MFDFDQEQQFSRSNRRVEKKLKLTDDHEQKVINNLVDVVDELRIFSTPTSIERIVEGVSIHQEDQRLPQRYSLLSMVQTTMQSGNYKTKLTLPGHTLTLEGSRPNASGMWRLRFGDKETLPLGHTDTVNYLYSILPESPNLQALADSTNISDTTMLESLWKDLTPLASNWTEASFYNAEIDQYVPSLTTDHPRKKDLKNAPDDGPYASSTGAVVGHIETPSKNTYVCRVGTQLPIDFSVFRGEENERKPSDVHQEYRFEVEFLKRDDRIHTALAHVAFESDTLTTSGLHDLVDLTLLYQDKAEIPSIYENVTDFVKAKHLDPDDFLNQ